MKTNAKPKSDVQAGRKKPLIFIPPEKRCAQLTERGSPCRAARWRVSRFCIFHDPNFRKLRKQLELRRKSSGQQLTARTAEGIQKMLENAAQDVREKRISPAAASSIGYLGQVMSANLKNLPPADGPDFPSKAYIDYEANNWLEAVNNKVNEEIARWIPDSSPFAVANAELDVIQVAADASAADAKNFASTVQAKSPTPSKEPPSCPSPWKKDPYDP